jgi:hypothetical protein
VTAFERARRDATLRPRPGRRPTAADRAGFRQGLVDARAGRPTPLYGLSIAYMRGRFLGEHLLAQPLVFAP